MPKKKSTVPAKPKKIANDKKEPNSRTAKLVLFIFGIGPLLLMSYFLSVNGFFN